MTGQPRVYGQCGLRIRSELVLDLPTIDTGACDVEVSWGPDIPDSTSPPPGEPVAQYPAPDGFWYLAARDQDHYRFRFHDCGEFLISDDLTEVTAHRDPGGRHELLTVLMAGAVSSFILSLKGHTVLHASAVLLDDSVVAFVGPSGRGKTTTAALMCLAGAQLVADDLMAITTDVPPRCRGGATELRLRENATNVTSQARERIHGRTADERHAYRPDTAPDATLPLGAVVIPSPSREAAEVELETVKPSDALHFLLASPRIQGWTDRDVLIRDLAALGNLVNNLPVFNATIPWETPSGEELMAELGHQLSTDELEGIGLEPT